ncbi:AAA family ATPase [Selenomonas sp. AB3002]|uniref:AAA family ATPase n=1 Tax=Selenomonas sp. AB3002 TaxID=1392502 RepID=UPI0004953C38
MKIRYLTLANFRNLKDKKLDLSGNKVTIYGRNGSGKTTVANAIINLLADSSVTGEKDFSPKTEGTHKLNHVATMTVVADDGEEISLSKDFHEIWKKKRGSQTATFSGHETTYEINGIPAKKKEYDSRVAGICGGDSKRIMMLSLAGYFAEDLPMDERRKILVDICGDISDDEILNLSGIAPLKEYLPVPGVNSRRYTPEEFLQMAKVKRRDLNKKIDEIPARIDELSRTLTDENVDFDELPNVLKALQEQKAQMQIQPKNTTILGIEAAMAGIRTAIEKGRESYYREHVDTTKERLESYRAQETEIQKEINHLSIQAFEAGEQLKKMESEREKCLADFDALKMEKWNPKSEICPTCGQVLPVDTVRQLRENWLEKLAERKAEINARGKEVSKENIAAQKEKADSFQERLTLKQAELSEVQNKKLALVNSEPNSSYEDSEKYKENKLRLEELSAKLEQAKAEQGDTKPDTSEIDAQIAEVQEYLARHKAQESARQRIEELQSEMKQASADLDYYDKGIHLCETFFREKMRYVSEKVSEHFETVGWRLFKEQINGGLAECCEPLIANDKGVKVEWKSANTAAQINAGLEIIDVLSKHFNTYLPVIVDRAESVTDLREMPRHQVIRLVVSKDDADLNVVNE